MELTIINQEGKLLVDSRDVAEMVGKKHSHIMRDIRGYIDILNESKFGLVDFFVESEYKDGKGEMRPCYLLTKKGCDMVANKMTGEKGVLFTATYVTKFDEMENKLKSQQPQLPTTYKEALVALLASVEENERLLEENKAISIENRLLNGEVFAWADRNLINAIVRKYGASTETFSKAWVEWKKTILYKYGININSRITNYLNKTGKKTKPKTLSMLTDEEVSDGIKVAISMCKDKDVDISELLKHN